MQLDRGCLQTCYDKYLYALQAVNEQLRDEGRARFSDFALASYGLERDLVKEEYFPIEGSPTGPKGGVRKKVFGKYDFARHNEKIR